MSTVWGLFIAVSIVGLIFSFVIWILSKLRLGLEVDSYGSAIIAAFVIAILGGLITWLLILGGLQDGNGFFGGIVHLIISAIILMVSSKILPGLKVKGFGGALVAAIAIGAVYWLGGLLLELVVA